MEGAGVHVIQPGLGVEALAGIAEGKTAGAWDGPGQGQAAGAAVFKDIRAAGLADEERGHPVDRLAFAVAAPTAVYWFSALMLSLVMPPVAG